MSENLKNHLLVALFVVLYLLGGYIAPVHAQEVKKQEVTCTADKSAWCPSKEDIMDEANKGLAKIKIQTCDDEEGGLRATCYCKDGSKVKQSCRTTGFLGDVRGFCLREKICEGASKTKMTKVAKPKTAETKIAARKPEPELVKLVDANDPTIIVFAIYIKENDEAYECNVSQSCPLRNNPFIERATKPDDRLCPGSVVCKPRNTNKKKK